MKKLLRGFRDIFSPQADEYTELEGCARKVFKLAGAKEIRIPTVELKELFVKSTGTTTDIVQKEMYAFEDRGGREIAMRPEGTPGVARAYIENNFAQNAPVQKLFYIGNMFRAERPQEGRYREFEQIGLEYLGNGAPEADAETILLLKEVVSQFGVNKYSVKLNSLGCEECRPVYKQTLIDYLKQQGDKLCDNCKTRLETNPLRVLDCKFCGSDFTKNAPKQKLCVNCESHFNSVLSLLDGRIEYSVDANLVRGLDYYTRTVFEFQAGNSAQNAIAGGGRYDSLIKSMGGAQVPAIGFAMGVERVIAARGQAQQAAPKKVFVVSLSKEANAKAFDIMLALRAGGIMTDGGLFDRNLKAQMKAADKSGARYTILLGEDELKNGEVTLKDLQTAQQQKIKFETIKEEVEKLP